MGKSAVLTCPHCKQEIAEADVARQRCPLCGGSVPSGQATYDSDASARTLVFDSPPAKPATVGDFSERTIDLPAPGSGSVASADLAQTYDSTSLPAVPKSGSTMHDRRNSPTLDQPASGSQIEDRLHAAWGSLAAESEPYVTMRGNSSREQRLEERGTLVVRERALRGSAESQTALADYDLKEVLGEGGMGVVYSARQASIDREVAVKMLRGDMVQDESLRRKFLSEAAVTGELDHPNIVPIYDLGQNADGALFYSMKKVQGTPWSKMIEQNNLLDNLAILMKVADAVAFAHARGVVHRDLKPENVMLGDFGEVLVLDWGLAVATEGHRPTPNVATAFSIAGTPAYMSPELALGPMDRIGRHSDIYLLGAILYEVVTGFAPHSGRNVRACLMAAARNEIVPTEKRGELVEIARKAMATNPADRYPSVRDFQDAIRQYQAHSESIALGERAEHELQAAAQSGDYRDYARSLFAFEEALALWTGNETARLGVSRAKLHYAAAALDKHDYDLGLSLLDPADASHAALRERLQSSKSERDARQQRLKTARRVVLGLAALVFFAVTVGIVLVTLLKIEADKQARIAKKNAVEADRQAGIARANAKRAIDQQNIAMAAKDEAQQRRQQAEYEAYGALVGMAAAKIDENAFDQARRALAACQPGLRGWEWRRLMYVVNQGRGRQFPLPARADCLAMNPQGNLLATGSRDGVVRIWDAAEQKLLAEQPLGVTNIQVTALAFSPRDDRWLAIGGNRAEGLLQLWNRQTGEVRPLAGPDGHQDAVVQVAFSRDGSKLLTASHDHTAKLWDLITLQPLVTFRGHSWWVWSAALSPDETQVATASDDGTVRLWDSTTGKEWTTPAGERVPFTAHQGPVYAVTFIPAASIGAPAQHPGASTAATAPNGPQPKSAVLASAGYDKRVLLWKAADLLPFDYKRLLADEEVPRTPFTELRGHTAAVRALSCSPDGSRLLSASSDHTLRIWYAQEEDLGYAIIRRGTLEKELRGHDGPVEAAVFSPASPHLVASTGYDGRLHLWNTDAYHEERVIPGLALRGHVDAVMAARFSNDGESIVTASRDRTAKKWRSADGSEALTYREGHAYLTSQAKFFPDGERLLTAAVDGTVRIWSLKAGTELRKIEGTGYRAAAALSGDGRWILTGSDQALPVSTAGSPNPGQSATVWDAETGQVLHRLAGHKVPVNVVAYSAKGDLAFTGDDHGVGNLWEPHNGRHIARLDFHRGPITAAAFTLDGAGLYTASADNTACRWDLSDRTKITPDRSRLLRHPRAVHALALAPDNRHLITGCEDGQLRMWDATTGQQVWSTAAEGQGKSPVSKGNINSVTISVDGAWMAAVDSVQNVVRLFAMDFKQGQGQEVRTPSAGGTSAPFLVLRDHDAIGWSAAFAPDNRHLVTVGGDEARQWNLQGTEVASFGPHRPVTFADFSPDDSRVVTASWDHSARIWDAATGQPLMTLSDATAGELGGHTATVNSAVFAPGGQQVLTASEDGTIRLWELATMRVARVFRAHTAGVTRAVFLHDGKRFVSTARDGTARVWNLAGDAQPVVLQGHSKAVLDAASSQNSRFIVTAAADNTARVWDAATGMELLKLEGHSGEVAAAAFGMDDQGKLRVLTGSADQTAKLWDVDCLVQVATSGKLSGKELLTLKGHTRGLTAVAFAPDGNSVLTAARDGVTIVWPAIAEAQQTPPE